MSSYEQPAQLQAVLEAAQRQGFVGPTPVAVQIDHADAHGEIAGLGKLAARSRVLDLGSGGGIPGLVLAHRYRELRFTLLDRSARRCAFLVDAVSQLKLNDPSDHGAVRAFRVTVAHGDAAELAHHHSHRHAYACVLSRSFGAPAAAAECATGFLSVGGKLVVSEPPATPPSRWPSAELARLGLELTELTQRQPRVAVLTVTKQCDEAFPRPWKQIVKRPLY